MIGKTNAQLGITSEKVTIVLQTNQDNHNDLLGVEINITYSDVEESYIWEGKDIIIDIPQYASYIVTFGEIEGYKTPEQYSSIAVEGNSVSLLATYKTEILTVNIEDSYGNIINEAIININGVRYTEPMKLAYGVSYTIQPNDIEGYISPDPITIIASQNSRLVILKYQNYEEVTVNVTGVNEFKIDIEYEDQLAETQTVPTATYRIPYGVKYSVIPNEVLGYNTPEPFIDIIASEPNREININYIAAVEHVIVSPLYLDQDVYMSVEEIYVTYEGNTHVLTDKYAHSYSFDIPAGIEYTITFPALSGYKTPSSYVRTAVGGTHEITIYYEVLSLGVFIALQDGTLTQDYDNLDVSKAVGVAVISDKASFIMGIERALYNWYNQSIQLSEVPVCDGTNYKEYFDGPTYTDKIIEQSNRPNAATYTRSTQINFGNDVLIGYLGSTGEWYIVLQNHDSITEAYEKLMFAFEELENCWTSCQYQTEYVWVYRPQNKGFYSRSGKTSYTYAIPFYKI